MTIGDRIQSARNAKDMSVRHLAEKSGVSHSSISLYERDKVKPGSKAIQKIADVLDVTSSYLLGESELPSGARSLSPSPAAYLPFYGRIHAGEPAQADDNPDTFAVPVDVYNAHKQGFILKVWGHCMNKVYPEGCHVVIDPNAEPLSGDIGAFSIDGEIVMRKVLKGANTLILVPESFDDSIEDIVISGDVEVSTLGKVVWFQAAEEL